ncbi:hypothetical protein MTO96_016424 [Rhipicephalus appendiculatus]
MATAVRQGSETVYYLDAAQLKAQQAVGGACGAGGICIPAQGPSGRAKKGVYRVVPSSPLQAERVYEQVGGATFAGGLQCDSCPPLCRQRKVAQPEDCRYTVAPEPQVMRVVPRGKNFYLEDVKPASQQPWKSSAKSTRQKLPNVMQIVEDRDWYNVDEDTEYDVAVEPEACRECLEELMRRRRSPEPEPAVVSSPVYVTKAPKSKRSQSRRIASPSPQRVSSRGPTPSSSPQRVSSRGPMPSSSPRCTTCTDCQPTYSTVRSISKPNTARSRSRKWYD